jgi:hypothetical protein
MYMEFIKNNELLSERFTKNNELLHTSAPKITNLSSSKITNSSLRRIKTELVRCGFLDGHIERFHV